jgi:hypothetical protein
MYSRDSILDTAFGADSRNGLFTNIRWEGVRVCDEQSKLSR